MIPSSLAWYVARSAGLLAWMLLTASVLWGLTLSGKALRRPRPAWQLDVHRFLGGMATIFTGMHVGAILADSYVHFDLASVTVPFASAWRPAAVAWGVVAVWLLLAVELTSLARAHMPRRLWRAIHVASFPLFLFATVHALSAGTDTRTWLFRFAAAGAVLAMCGLLAHRMSSRRPSPRPALTQRGA
jgi:hypothetical protein